MNPGKLDKKIQIQRQAAGLYMVTATGEYMTTADGERMTTSTRQNARGQEVDVWGLWKTRYARRIENTGKEASPNSREHSTAAVKFQIRYTAGLSAADRVVDVTSGIAYDLEDWTEPDYSRRQWLILHCTRRRTPENANQAIA
jgi:head-tail adaptor